MQKILGLDIGNYSIKAVEIVNTFKTYEVTHFYETIVPQIFGIDSENIATTILKQMLSENEIQVDKIYTALSGLYVSMRIFHLPNVKKRNIPLVVQNELEGQSPFPFEEALLDQQILEIKDGISSVLTVVCRRDHVEAYLNGLKSVNIEPKIIDVDYLSFMNLYNYLDLDKDKCSLLVDVGHVKTSLLLFNKGRLIIARTLQMGGRNVTEFLRKTLDISYAEAQRLKHRVGRLDYAAAKDDLTEDDDDTAVAKKICVAVDELIREIIRTLHAFKAQEKISPHFVTVMGGGSVLRNFPEYLSKVLEIPVYSALVNAEKLTFASGEGSDPAMAQALAIALRGMPNKFHSQINLRKGELALVGSYDAVMQRITNSLLVAASVFICLLGSYGLRWWLYRNRIESIKQDYRKEVTQLMGGTEDRQLKNIAAKSSWDFKAYHEKAIKILEESIKTKDSILDGFINGKPALTLFILDEISKVLPKDVKIDVTSFSLDSSSLTMEAETDSFATSDKILEFLKTLSLFSVVEKKTQETKPGSDGKIVKFVLAAQVKEGI